MIGFALALQGCEPDIMRIVKRTRHPLEPVYAGMLRRCYNPKEPLYHRYGGRGINVCDRWRMPNGIGFSNFANDMGNRPENCFLDRANNNGNYDPANCRWVDRTTNNRNREISSYVTLNGQKAFLHDLSKGHGVPRETIRKRLLRGLSIEKALSKDNRHDNEYHRARKARKGG